MDTELKNRLTNFKIDVLSFLHAIAVTGSVALDISTISESTSTPEENIHGIVATLRRVKVNEEPIITQAGRDLKGRYRWKINEKAVGKNELADYLEKEILGKENIKWA